MFKVLQTIDENRFLLRFLIESPNKSYFKKKVLTKESKLLDFSWKKNNKKGTALNDGDLCRCRVLKPKIFRVINANLCIVNRSTSNYYHNDNINDDNDDHENNK